MTITEPQLFVRKGSHWRGWVVLWVAFVAIEVILLANHAAADTWAWRATRWVMGDQDAYKWAQYQAKHAGDPAVYAFEHRTPPLHAHLYKRTEGFWRLFRDLGEPITTGLLIAVVWVYDRRGWKAPVLLLGATISSGIVGEVIRVIAGRWRPIATDGANVWALFRGFHEGNDLSWPSGHSTLAFATAAALVYLSPRGRWLFIVLACGCAAARVVMQAHFWGDVLFGAILGWTIGWFVVVWMDRVIPNPQKME